MVTEQFIVTAGAGVRFLTGGPDDGPVVLLLHDGGWGASADATWGRMLPLIEQEFRVVAPDLLGFGGSDKVVFLDRSPYMFRMAHVVSLLDALAIEQPVHLVGNSFGGSVVLRAMTEPRWRPRIASVATIAGTGGPWRTPKALAELAKFDGTVEDMARIVRLLADEFDGFDEYVKQRHHWAALPGQYQSMMAPHAKPPEGLQPPRPDDPYPATLAGADIPVLLMTGERDELVEPDWMDKLRPHIPGVETMTMPAKHSPNLSHPRETWDGVGDFIRRSSR